MNIRSLLLGSAAAMVAVSGAQAADAVVIEPEPVEYVRVCDAYGSGFFFIPGTETCIRFSGFVRSAFNKAYVDTTLAAGGVNADTRRVTDEAGAWAQRARVNIDTRNETDWGTLRALIRLEAGGANETAATAFRADIAMMSLAGFRIGQNGGTYFVANHGFAGVNLEGAGGPFIATDGWYGFRDSTFLDYTWAADGLAVTIGVEDVRTGSSDLDGTLNGNDAANFYAGVNYSADWGTVAFSAAHDTDSVEINAAGGVIAGSRGNWAYKASVSLDLSEYLPGGVLYGSYAYDGEAMTEYVYSDVHVNVDDIWSVAFQMNLTDEVEFIAAHWHAEGSNANTVAAVAPAVGVAGVAGRPGGLEGDADLTVLGLNWYPSAAPGFHIKAAYFFGEADNVQANTGALVGTTGAAVDHDFDGFEISLRRDF